MEIFDPNVLIESVIPVEENRIVMPVELVNVYHRKLVPIMSDSKCISHNVYSKAQTQKANLKLAKSKFKTVFIND